MQPLKISKTALFMIALLTVAGQKVRAASPPAGDCTPVRLADISQLAAEKEDLPFITRTATPRIGAREVLCTGACKK
jgi:hypothetical protein